MSDIVTCPYCGKQVEMIFGSELYPRIPEVVSIAYWTCRPCDAHAKIENGGSLANKKLRTLRIKAHEALDILWSRGYMTRKESYSWLASVHSIPLSVCHIALFNEDVCLFTIITCQFKLKEYEEIRCI